MDPDVEKKKRKRSARVYINANRPLAVPLDEIAAEFPPDDDGDGQEAPPRARRMVRPDETKRDIGQAARERLAREGKALVNADGHVSYPIETVEDLHNAASLARTGHGDVRRAKKLIARRARELGVANPLESSQKAVTGNPVEMHPARSVLDRTSPPLGPGHGAYSAGDHGAAEGTVDPMNRPGPSEMAFRHPDLRQGTTTPFPLGTRQTDATAFPADLRGMGNGVPVALSRLDAAAAAGMPGPPANPFARPGDHIAATGRIDTGPHSGANPTSTPPPAMKNSDRVALMKRHMFPGSGGGR